MKPKKDGQQWAAVGSKRRDGTMETRITVRRHGAGFGMALGQGTIAYRWAHRSEEERDSVHMQIGDIAKDRGLCRL